MSLAIATPPPLADTRRPLPPRAPVPAPSTLPRPGVTRILHVVKHCGYGNGNVHVAVDLASLQAGAGCEVALASEAGGTFVPMLRENGVRHLEIAHEQSRPLGLLAAGWRLAGAVRAMRAEVIHAHMMASALVGAMASRLTGVPLVTTVHNSFDPHARIMRLGRRIVAVSEAERRSLLAQGWPAARLDAVVNAPVGSPREAFMRNPEPIELRGPAILVACGLHRRKGVSDILRAAAEVFREVGGWTLYIAGEGPDEALLREEAARLGLGARAVFLGFVPAPRTLLEQAEIFVLASHADPCSLVIGEARGAGCAIVASAVGGTPEMLEEGRAGRLVPPGEPARLAAELRELMTGAGTRAALQTAARQGAERFHWTRLLADYDQVYLRASRPR